ncbi:MAG TPA: hypothetical protein DD622_07250 [Opitutae bacterium]|nr:hypothetical protein [Opitutae bacterium]
MNFKQILFSVLSFSPLFAAQVTLVEINFDEANGTNINSTVSSGAVANGTWSSGGPKVQNGNLNWGMTISFRWPGVDNRAGIAQYRTFQFEAVDATDYSTYELLVDLDRWDLRRNWDQSDSAPDKGINVILVGVDDARVRASFTTDGNNSFGFKASATGEGLSGANSLSGADFTNNLYRYSSIGGILKINGNLTTGNWTISAADGESRDFYTVGSGSGLYSINKISLASSVPREGSWGGDTNSQGDFVLIDSIKLTALSSMNETSEDGLVFSISGYGGEYSVVGYDISAPTQLVIPYTFNNLPVTSINGSAFQDFTSLVSVTIPDNVTVVPYRAFKGCTALETVNLPDNLTRIGGEAFQDCSSLKSIKIPAGVNTFGSDSFYNCSDLKYLVFDGAAPSTSGNVFNTTLYGVIKNSNISSFGGETQKWNGMYLVNDESIASQTDTMTIEQINSTREGSIVMVPTEGQAVIPILIEETGNVDNWKDATTTVRDLELIPPEETRFVRFRID